MVFFLILTGCADRRIKPTTKYMSGWPLQREASVTVDIYTANKIENLLALKKAIPNLSKGAMIELISRQFLDTPYVANRLIGSATMPEQLVIDFGALDCFTYLDYVDALRHAASMADFVDDLIRTRYIGGHVAFLGRKHFFSDWAYSAPTLGQDITAKISPHAVSQTKVLNRKASYGNFISGLPDVKRTITYIPSQYIDQTLMKHLRTGDYIGIYADAAGLDVTHVGIYLNTENGPMLRNASSQKDNMKVVDSPFLEYVKNTPGIIVYRPR